METAEILNNVYIVLLSVGLPLILLLLLSALMERWYQSFKDPSPEVIEAAAHSDHHNNSHE